MSRVLTVTGAPAGDGLLKRALELRDRVSRQNDAADAAPATADVMPKAADAVQTADTARSEIEKKKPSHRFLPRAA